MTLLWTVVGIVVVMVIVTAFWLKVGPSVLVPHDGSREYDKDSWAKVSRPAVVVMAVITVIAIAIAAVILG